MWLAVVVGLLVGIFAQSMVERQAKTTHTFGFHRAEVLGAMLSVGRRARIVKGRCFGQCVQEHLHGRNLAGVGR